MARNTRSRAVRQHAWPSESFGSSKVRLCSDCGVRYDSGHGRPCPACGSTQTVPGPKTGAEKTGMDDPYVDLFTDRRVMQ